MLIMQTRPGQAEMNDVEAPALSRPGTDNDGAGGRPGLAMNISCQHNISYKVQILTQFAKITRS